MTKDELDGLWHKSCLLTFDALNASLKRDILAFNKAVEDLDINRSRLRIHLAQQTIRETGDS